MSLSWGQSLGPYTIQEPHETARSSMGACVLDRV
jgi:hypothetical protein